MTCVASSELLAEGGLSVVGVARESVTVGMAVGVAVGVGVSESEVEVASLVSWR